MLEQTEEFMSAAGLGDALAGHRCRRVRRFDDLVHRGVRLIFQDVMIGDGKDCDCGSCTRLREMAGLLTSTSPAVKDEETGPQPELLSRGRYSLYKSPDGGMHLAYRPRMPRKTCTWSCPRPWCGWPRPRRQARGR